MNPNFTTTQKTIGKFAQEVSPLIRNMNRAIEPLRPIIETQNKLRERLGQIFKNDGLRTNLLSHKFMETSLSVVNFRKEVFSIFPPEFLEIGKSLALLPERAKSAVIKLAKEGWFFDLGMSLSSLWKLEKAIIEGNAKEAVEELIEYFEGELNDIEKGLVEKFPHRKRAIIKAFKAHRNHDYELSVPVFLIQADGVCHDLTNQYFFLKKDNRPRTAMYIDSIYSEAFKIALLAPLTQSLPISDSEKERGVDFDNLNRHMVLHGESNDYGTKVNSCKALSLLNYVACVLNDD